MRPTKSIYILLSLFLISNCGDKVREEITERYENGQKKLLVIYKGEGSDEVIVERITYNENGDINGDGGINVLDVVALVQFIIPEESAREKNATKITK